MKKLLNTIIIVRTEENISNIEELLVGSHEHVNIKILAVRKAEKEAT